MASLECLTLTSCGRDGIFRNAVVCGPYRFEFRAVWSDGPRLVTIGLNPPGGFDLKISPTVALLTNYARRNKFGGIVMLNLFAWKSTRPAHLFAAMKRGEDIVGTGNDFQSLKLRIEINSCGFDDIIVAMWGNHGLRRGGDFLRFLGIDYTLEHVKCFGLNRDGSPVHPLRSLVPPLIQYPGVKQ